MPTPAPERTARHRVFPFGAQNVDLDVPCGARQVKEAFLLAEAMRTPPADPDAFRARVAAERGPIGRLADADVDARIADESRLARYSAAAWRLAVVDLADCSVWPGMGGRKWVSGPVPRARRLVLQDGNRSDRLFGMAVAAPQMFADLPLIVFRRKRAAGQYRIDDGSNRAVAYCLAGCSRAFAYVGTYSGPHELPWRWEGEPWR